MLNLCRIMTVTVAGVGAVCRVESARYNLIDLGTGVAKSINSAGRVVGNATSGGWYYDGTNRITLKFTAHALGVPPGQGLFFTAATANAINDDGRIVGSVIFIPLLLQSRTPFFYDGGGVATLVGAGDASGLNAAGVVVGGDPAFILNGTQVATPPGVAPRVNAVNASGVAVGSVSPNGAAVAASFNGASFTRLNLQGLGLPDTGNEADYQSAAIGVNNAGKIVGNVELHSSPLDPKPSWGFLFAGTTASPLGTLGGAMVSARDINNNGVVVGEATIGDGSSHAFIHDPAGISDLNLAVTGVFGWVLASANAVNDGGLIVGEGRKDGVQRAFLLIPIPDGQPPVINTQPLDAKVYLGDAVGLGVGATGDNPLQYQWTHAGTNIPAATSGSYSIAHATANDAGIYRVVVSNKFGSATSGEAKVEVRAKDLPAPILAVALYSGITITGQVGRSYRIEAVESAADASWESLATVTLDVSPYVWIDAPASLHRSRLYRAVPLP